jgi:hypothetical protein
MNPSLHGLKDAQFAEDGANRRKTNWKRVRRRRAPGRLEGRRRIGRVAGHPFDVVSRRRMFARRGRSCVRRGAGGAGRAVSRRLLVAGDVVMEERVGRQQDGSGQAASTSVARRGVRRSQPHRSSTRRPVDAPPEAIMPRCGAPERSCWEALAAGCARSQAPSTTRSRRGRAELLPEVSSAGPGGGTGGARCCVSAMTRRWVGYAERTAFVSWQSWRRASRCWT